MPGIRLVSYAGIESAGFDLVAGDPCGPLGGGAEVWNRVGNPSPRFIEKSQRASHPYAGLMALASRRYNLAEDRDPSPKDLLRALLHISPENVEKAREHSPAAGKRKPPEDRGGEPNGNE
jgi:hypothetical protein